MLKKKTFALLFLFSVLISLLPSVIAPSNIFSDGEFLYMGMEDGVLPFPKTHLSTDSWYNLDYNYSIGGKYCANLTSKISGTAPLLVIPTNTIMPESWEIKFKLYSISENVNIILYTPVLSTYTSLSSFNFLSTNNSMYMSDYKQDGSYKARFFNSFNTWELNTIYTLKWSDIRYYPVFNVGGQYRSNIANVTLSNSTISQTLNAVGMAGHILLLGQYVPISYFAIACSLGISPFSILFDEWTVGTNANVETNAAVDIGNTYATLEGEVVNDGSPLQNGSQNNLTTKFFYDSINHTNNFTYYFNDYSNNEYWATNPNNAIDGNENTYSNTDTENMQLTLYPSDNGTFDNLNKVGASYFWQTVVSNDGDTTYSYTNVLTDVGSGCSIENVSLSSYLNTEINSVSVTPTVRRTGAGVCWCGVGVKPLGAAFVNYGYQSNTIDHTYYYDETSYSWLTNPFTSNIWTWGDINDLEIAALLEQNSVEPRITQLRAIVDYNSFENNSMLFVNHTGNISNLPYGNISKIEMRAKTYREDNGVNVFLQPVYNFVNKTLYKLNPGLSGSWSNWFDITGDINNSIIDSNDLKKLNCRIIRNNSENKAYVSKIELRITINITKEYKYNVSVGNNITGDILQKQITNLLPGTVYFYRAYGSTNYTNASSYSYSEEKTFLTKPNSTTGFTLTNLWNGHNLTWSKGIGADRSVVVMKTTGYPSSVSDGTVIYNDTGEAFDHVGLTAKTTYYYRIWSFSHNATYSLSQFSATYESLANTFKGKPTVTTNAATSVTNVTATLRGTLDDDGGEDCTVRFEYGPTVAYGTNTTNQTKSTGDSFSAAVSGLSPGTLYHCRAFANNSFVLNSTAVGSDVTFLTNPNRPFTFNASVYATTNNKLNWSKGAGATYTYVVRKIGSVPASRSDGTFICNTTGVEWYDMNVTAFTTYYYAAWSFKSEGGFSKWSLDYLNDSIRSTDISPPIISVNVTSNEGIGQLHKGYVNVSAYDDNSTYIIINITVNGVEFFNETVSNPGQTATYTFNATHGVNTVLVRASDDFGNMYNYSESFIIYIVNMTFVNERNGSLFNWARAKAMGNMTGCNATFYLNGSKLNLYENETVYLDFITMQPELMRIEMLYRYVGIPIIRSFRMDLLNAYERIGLVEIQEAFYEQLFYSSSSKPVIVVNMHSNATIHAEYTYYSYESQFTSNTYTIGMLYYLYTISGGRRVYLSGLEGSRSAQINLDFLEFSQDLYNFTILQEGLSVSRYSETMFLIFYKNLAEDNKRVDMSIYDGDNKIFFYVELLSPNEMIVYFNFATLDLVNDVLKIELVLTKVDGRVETLTHRFSVSGKPITDLPPEVAAVFAIMLVLFGITLASSGHVFGYFGMTMYGIGLALTAFTAQVWYITLIQAVFAILLIYTIIVFKTEGAQVA